MQLTTSPAIAAKRLLCAALLLLSSVCQSFSVGFVVHWLGGSFAKLGFSQGLCGFANVPPKALANISFVLKSPLMLLSLCRNLLI